jgi:hypothetical protein
LKLGLRRFAENIRFRVNDEIERQNFKTAGQIADEQRIVWNGNIVIA